METAIRYCTPGHITLVVADPSLPPADQGVLASLIHYHHTGCWWLTDIRLARHQQPSPYSASVAADDYCAAYRPKTPKEAQILKSLLREYQISEEGEFLWCTFEGLVRGTPEVHGVRPVTACDQMGFFSRREGLARLEAMRAFWAETEDPGTPPGSLKITNPHRQPTVTEMAFLFSLMERRSLDVSSGNALIAQLRAPGSPGGPSETRDGEDEDSLRLL